MNRRIWLLVAFAAGGLLWFAVAGAGDARVTADETRKSGADSDEGRQHWSFRPVQRTEPPQVADSSWPLDALDRFILAKLGQHGLTPAREADRFTWLRRVRFDLTGLPPTPEEIAEFAIDASPDAYERVVDRLLASPAFGERWARHWLDLVGYADQIGTSNDIFAEHAWRYRDYVIDAFNADKPYDQFICEQIAGDLLPGGSVEERAARLTATGFLVLGDVMIVEADKAKLRVDVVDQQVDKVGKAFLGMTLGCARCHDHKFDPISQRDYYALAGIFHSTESVHRAKWGVWSWVHMTELPETEAQQADRAERARRHAEKLAGLKAERDRANEHKGELDAALKADGLSTGGDESLEGRRKELKDLESHIGRLGVEITHAEFFAPAAPAAFAVRDSSEPADMHVTIRGNPHALGDCVPRGFPRVVSAGRPAAIAAGQSGRRELADWIGDPANPLTARVAVNRIWQKLFGEGLVRSVDYFGLRGESPSHPELLDHLALRFVEHGWSQKRFIRDVVLCRAYRMTSADEPAAAAADPDNRWLWRMNRRRLDAEALRDALLAVSGKLAASAGGPALPLEFPENTSNLTNGVNPPAFKLTKFRPEQEFERTVYLPVVRVGSQKGPAELRDVFDFTQPTEMAGCRAVTAVPTQALFLMNARMIKDRARELAQRLLAGATDEPTRLESLWLTALNRPILADERVDAAAFLAETTQHGNHAPPNAAQVAAWTELCHAVLASNEFLMRF